MKKSRGRSSSMCLCSSTSSNGAVHELAGPSEDVGDRLPIGLGGDQRVQPLMRHRGGRSCVAGIDGDAAHQRHARKTRERQQPAVSPYAAHVSSSDRRALPEAALSVPVPLFDGLVTAVARSVGMR
jgi:hypothetical protein